MLPQLLCGDLKPEQIQAKYEDGILQFTLPKEDPKAFPSPSRIENNHPKGFGPSFLYGFSDVIPFRKPFRRDASPATLGLSLDSFYQLRDWLKDLDLQGDARGR